MIFEKTVSWFFISSLVIFSCGNQTQDMSNCDVAGVLKEKKESKDSVASANNVSPQNMQTADTDQLVTGEGFEMFIPKNYSSANDLNKNAVLQYCDTSEDKYVIVMTEIKDDFVRDLKDTKMYDANQSIGKNYRMAEMKMMATGVTMKETPEIKSAKIDGRESEIANIVGTVNEIGYDVFYKVAFIEGEKKLYMIMSWTLAEDRNQNDAEMEKMLNSFKIK